MSEYIIDLGKRSKNASAELNKADTVAKDNFFGILIKNLDNNRDKIKSENAIDIKDGEKKGLTKAFLDRYNNGKLLPKYTDDIKKWFNLNRDKMIEIDIKDKHGEEVDDFFSKILNKEFSKGRC